MDIATIRKAIAPALLALFAIAAQWIATGALDVAELRTGIAGIFTAFVVYFVPNAPPS